MTRAKLIMCISALLVFAAGTSVGMLLRGQPAAAEGKGQQGPRGRMAEELKLTPDQQKRMEKIWTETMGELGRNRGERRNQANQERDRKVQELLDPAQRERYEAIHKDGEESLRARQAALEEQLAEARRAINAEGDQKIQALLSEPQRTEYAAIQAEHARRLEELSQQRRAAEELAVERTKKEVLTTEQAAKYDKILSQWRERSGGAWHGPGLGRRGGRTGSTSAPATTTSRQRTGG